MARRLLISSAALFSFCLLFFSVARARTWLYQLLRTSTHKQQLLQLSCWMSTTGHLLFSLFG